MGEPRLLVTGAGAEVLDLDTGQLCADHTGEIDRRRSPTRLGNVFGEPGGDLGPDLETARSDVWADDGAPHLSARGIEAGTKGRDDARGNAAPTGMCHTDRAIRHHHDTCTIGGEHRQWEPWDLREQSVCRAVISRRRNVDDVRTVDLVDDGPSIGDAELRTQALPGILVTPEVAVTGFGEHDESAGHHP